MDKVEKKRNVCFLQGTNILHFTRTSGRQLVFKEFFLFKTKPVFPPQPGNYTPAPTPPTPPPGDYIEVGVRRKLPFEFRQWFTSEHQTMICQDKFGTEMSKTKLQLSLIVDFVVYRCLPPPTA